MDDLMDEYEDKLRQEKEDRLDMTQEDVDNMQNYIDECDMILKKLDELKGLISNDELLDMADWLKECFCDETGNTYDRYKEKIEEWEDYDPNDYVDNSGISKSFINERLKGLK